MVSAIYVIFNVLTGQRYIGSSKDCETRWQQHRRQLKSGNHHNVYLQRAWNKHGADAFVFSVVKECPEERLCDEEQIYLNGLSDNDYNLSNDSRRPSGPANVKLTVSQVAEIKRRLVNGERQIALSKEFGVRQTNISSIKTLVHWENIAPEFNEALAALKHQPAKESLKYSDIVVAAVKEALKTESVTSVAQRFNIPRPTISSIKNGMMRNR